MHNCSEYHQACLYAHAVSNTSLEWLAEEFFNDAKSLKNGSSNYIQFTSYSIGLALNKNENPDISKKDIEKIIKKLTQLVDSAELTSEQLTSCVLALGWICAFNNIEAWNIGPEIISNVKDVLSKIEYIYEYDISQKSERVRSIAGKLIDGYELSDDDEKFLLEKINV